MLKVKVITCPDCKGWGDVRGAFTYCPRCAGMGSIAVDDDESDQP